MRFSLWSISIILLFPLLVGCSSSPPTNFYVLDSSTTQSLAKLPKGIGVVIGPIEIPLYLDRKQIAVRKSKTELDLSETHQWSEPIKTGIARSIMVMVGERLNTNQIYVFPMKRSHSVDYQVPIDMVRFEGDLGGEAVLLARWTVLNKTAGETISSKVSEIRVPATGTSYTAYVSALSRTVEELAKQIAGEITSQ